MVKLDKFRNLVQDGESLLLLKYGKGERKPVDLNHPKDKAGSSLWYASVCKKRGQEVFVQISTPPEPSLPVPWPSCCVHHCSESSDPDWESWARRELAKPKSPGPEDWKNKITWFGLYMKCERNWFHLALKTTFLWKNILYFTMLA